MTAHKSKGLEFDHVFVVGAIDSVWGERVRSRNRLIGYPENLQLAPAGDTYDERLRLFFVAITRAKQALYISYALCDDRGKSALPASFLVGLSLQVTKPVVADDNVSLTFQQELLWHERLTTAPTDSMKSLLEPTLEVYKLSSTHLNNFIDITRGGPAYFLMNNLLRFPQAKSANAAYGTAESVSARIQDSTESEANECVFGWVPEGSFFSKTDFTYTKVGCAHPSQGGFCGYQKRQCQCPNFWLAKRNPDLI